MQAKSAEESSSFLLEVTNAAKMLALFTGGGGGLKCLGVVRGGENWGAFGGGGLREETGTCHHLYSHRIYCTDINSFIQQY